MANWRLTITVVLSGMMAVSSARPALAGFQAQQPFGTGEQPTSVAIADLNGDGRPDLAVTNFEDDTVSVLLNTTTAGATIPSFTTQQSFGTGEQPSSVAIADLNGDGRPDLAVANNTATVSVLLNTTVPKAATPSFALQQTFATGLFPTSVAAADFNGDGRPDLAVSDSIGDTVGVLLNATAPRAATLSFEPREPFSTGSFPASVTAADLNGDGKPDLAVANQNSNSVGVLLNTTATGARIPTFATQQAFSTGRTPASVAAADLNDDGKPDLAIANSGALSNSVSVLLNMTVTGAATPSFGSQQAFDTGRTPVSVAAADLNGDSRPDLAIGNFGDDTVSVLLNATATGAATPSFAAQQPFETGDAPRSVATADLNGDGKPDLAVANGVSDTVGVLLAGPSGTIQLSSPEGTVAEGAGIAAVPLRRTGSPDGQVSAIVRVTGGAATPGQDFTLASPQTVTWADGDGADKTVSIPIVQDQLDEGDETIQLALSLPANPFGASLGAQTTSTLTIADDDPLVLNIGNASVAEGNGGTANATFTVTRTGATVRTVTVAYATSDGSAQAGSDYTATSGTLTFAPSEASRTIAVPIIGEAIVEPDETFTVTLSNPTNATISTAIATGTIQNDDTACAPRPRVTRTVTAGGGALNVRVESTPLNTSAGNPLRQIRFGALQNAAVTLNGQAVASGQTVSLPPNTVGVDLMVRRAAAGQPTTVPFTVVDGCGEWQTFVGGGTSAGF